MVKVTLSKIYFVKFTAWALKKDCKKYGIFGIIGECSNNKIFKFRCNNIRGL